MTDQLQHSEGPERDNPLGLEPEAVEALRLSAALARHESGAAPDLDSREDPSLVETAVAITAAFDASTTTEAFERFHHRTRANIVAAVAGARQPATAQLQAPRPSLLQRWNGVFAAAGAAAAASIATFVVTVAALGNNAPVAPFVADVQPSNVGSEPAVAVIQPDDSAVNMTALSLDGQLDLWLDTLLQVAALTADGQPVDGPLLRTLTDATASVARTIEREPEAMNGASVFVTYQAAFRSQQTLNGASVNETDQPALDTAQLAADQAFVVASRYFEQNPERIPSVDDVAARLGTDNSVGDDTEADADDETAP
ncbi:MAG: hypothetical protein HOH95_06810 [Dehalococcoidia bacterium]|jgi:hypothetical protein|nr:hypothetical protein [Dehalococcoidia bacterium]